MGTRADEEEEEYDFEYSDEEQEETDVDLENTYYAAKALKTEDPAAAVEAFREASGVVRLSGREHWVLSRDCSLRCRSKCSPCLSRTVRR